MLFPNNHIKHNLEFVYKDKANTVVFNFSALSECLLLALRYNQSVNNFKKLVLLSTPDIKLSRVFLNFLKNC